MAATRHVDAVAQLMGDIPESWLLALTIAKASPLFPQSETRHLARIADQQQTIINRRNVPRPSLYRGEARQFLVPLRRRAHQHQVALLGCHHQVSASQQQLPIAIAPTLPLQLAGLGVDARQNRFVEAIDVALIEDGPGRGRLRVREDRTRKHRGGDEENGPHRQDSSGWQGWAARYFASAQLRPVPTAPPRGNASA